MGFETVIFLIVAVWAACGVFAYGLAFAFFQRKWPSLAELDHWGDRGFAVFVGVMGPIGLGVSYFCGERGAFGLKWR